MTLQGLRFAHVAFRVRDIDRTIQWYRDVLGAEVVCHVEAVGPKPEYYYAEEYHQQYLAKNPGGYCGLGGTGLSCPIGVASAG